MVWLPRKRMIFLFQFFTDCKFLFIIFVIILDYPGRRKVNSPMMHHVLNAGHSLD